MEFDFRDKHILTVICRANVMSLYEVEIGRNRAIRMNKKIVHWESTKWPDSTGIESNLSC